MRKQKPRSSPKNRSWRQIRQTANRKVVTAHARRRILKSLFRGALVVATVVGAASAVYFGFGYWQQGLQKVNTVLPAQPLRDIVYTTDGVLTRTWVESMLALPEEVDIMSINIHEKKLQLEAHGQVRSAVIRRLTDSLTIDLQERQPVIRIATRNDQGRVVVLLVDREGYVYQGTGYDRFELESLPFLGGVQLQRSGNGFRRLSGIDQVDDLLTVARGNFPNLYRSWQVVDYGSAPLIKIQSEDFREIIFSPGRYVEQLQWLDMIVANNRRQLMGMQDRVDLSLGNQVVVR